MSLLDGKQPTLLGEKQMRDIGNFERGLEVERTEAESTLPAEENQIKSQNAQTKSETAKSCSNEKVKENANFYCLKEYLTYLRLLASHRRKGPGSVVDEALSRYFSSPEIVSELKQAFKEEQQQRDKDRLTFESRFKK